MRSLLSAVLLTCALGTALPAQVRTFQLTGTFESGATFSGFFTMNGAARSLLSWNITTQAEPGWIERTYTSGGTGSSSFAGNSSTVPNEFGFAVRQSTSSMFVVWFSGQATAFTGGAIQPYPASCQTVPSGCAPAWEAIFNSSDARFVSGGTATLVPEPSAALLLMPAPGGLLLRTARRRGQQVA